MKAQIEKVDLPVDNVVLEAQLIEVSESNAQASGIDFTNSSGQIAVVTAQSGQFIPSGNIANSGSHILAGGAVAGGRLTSAVLQATIYAQ